MDLKSIYKNMIETTSICDFVKFSFNAIVRIYCDIDDLYSTKDKIIIVKKWILGVLNLKLKMSV
jgi:hypothetical protein